MTVIAFLSGLALASLVAWVWHRAVSSKRQARGADCAAARESLELAGERRELQIDRVGLPQASGSLLMVSDLTELSRATCAALTLPLAQAWGKLALWRWDGNAQRMRYLSPPLESLGLELASEVTRSNWEAMLHPTERASVQQAWRAFLDHPDTALEISYRVKLGEAWHWIAERARALPDAANGAAQIVGCHREVTHEMEREVALRAQTEALAAKTQELATVQRELDALAYAVSHDLRAPVRHIDGFGELLRQQAGSTLEATAQRYLDTMCESAQRLSAQMDDLLKYSRAGRAPLYRGVVALESMVRDLVQELSATATGRKIEWRIGPLRPVIGDTTLLREALFELLDNAVKFTRPREVAHIEVDHASGPAKEVVLFVKDDGVGFDPAQSDRLFGVFQRLHAEREFEGTGSGLATVRRIVHRHGGRVWAQGGIDQGATFFIALPM